MIKILIVGQNSYVGDSFAKWLANDPLYYVEIVDAIADVWKEKDFSSFDVVYLVAAIVHIKGRRALYYKVNRDMAIEVAKKAKAQGCKQFVFMSTTDVFRVSRVLSTRTVGVSTKTDPNTHYGDSKLQAEKGIEVLNEDSFTVTVVRPPIIYGKGCKGNFPRLVSLAKTTPFFPRINNKRSMVYIDNFCAYLECLIRERKSGVFYPQNKDYVCIPNLVKEIREYYGRKTFLVPGCYPLLFFASFFLSQINKLFGSFMCERQDFEYSGKPLIGLKDSVYASLD